MGRINELADLDVTTEEGYRAFSIAAAQLCRDLAKDLDTVAAMVGTALAATPPAQDNANAKSEARKIRQYLKRAAVVQSFAAGQISGAFRRFEVVFVPDKNRRQQGMKMSSRSRSKAA